MSQGSTTFCTADGLEGRADDQRRSLEAGFDHHLVKPVDASMLRRLLAELPPGGVALEERDD